MAACDPDSSVEICSSAANPVIVQPIAGGAGGLTDAELRATPVKVDDDATQAILTAQLDITLAALRDALRGAGSKTLSDVNTSLANVANLDIALSALRDAIRGTSSRTLTSLYDILDGLEGSVDGLETLLAGGLPAALSTSGGLKVEDAATAAANILTGYINHSATTGATTVVTIPAGRTWRGMIGAHCDVANGAANTATAQAAAVFATAGAGVTPAAGTILQVRAIVGASAAGGLTGTGDTSDLAVPFTIVAPGGNTVTVTVASTISGSFGQVAAFASGVLL